MVFFDWFCNEIFDKRISDDVGRYDCAGLCAYNKYLASALKSYWHKILRRAEDTSLPPAGVEYLSCLGFSEL
jgi:hypothetical protein